MKYGTKHYKRYALYMCEMARGDKEFADKCRRRIGQQANDAENKYLICLNKNSEYGHICCMLLDMMDAAKDLKLASNKRPVAEFSDFKNALNWLYGFVCEIEDHICEIRRDRHSKVKNSETQQLADELIERFDQIDNELYEKVFIPVNKMISTLDAKISSELGEE